MNVGAAITDGIASQKSADERLLEVEARLIEAKAELVKAQRLIQRYETTIENLWAEIQRMERGV